MSKKSNNKIGICFHNFESVCMFTGGPCSDGYNGALCELFLQKDEGERKIKDGFVFSMMDNKFVKKEKNQEMTDEEFLGCINDDWDD